MTVLADVARINPKLTTPLPDDQVVSFLGMADVFESGKTNLGVERLYSEVKKGFTPFLAGDVLVAKITPCFENGKIAQAETAHAQAFGSTEFHVVRGEASKVDQRYLLHLLRTPDVRTSGEQRMTGSAGQKRVPKAFFETLEIPLPSLPEQRRIASILDHADALRTKRRRALALLDDVVRAMFIDTFGDPISNPLGWPCRPLRDLGRVVTGNTPPRADQNNYGEILEWIKSDNIAPPNEYLTPAVECLSEQGRRGARVVKEGAVLVTCIAGSPNSIGNAALADREVAFNQQINAFVPDAPYPLFALMRLRLGKQLVQDASSGGMKGLVSKGRFESIVVPDPPIGLISEFETRAEQLVRTRSDAAAHLAQLDELFASLQHRAFRGEL